MTRIQPLAPVLSRPWLAAGLVALVTALAVYGTAATTGPSPPVNASTGEEHRLTLAEGEQVDRTFAWNTTLPLDASPEAYDLVVVVPYEVDPSSKEADGANVWLNATVNGEAATSHLYRAGSARVKLTIPGPHLDTKPFQEGRNHVEVQATVQRDASWNGSAHVTAGPLIAEAHPADRDADGIADPEQPLQGLHTGWVAALAGVALGAPAGLATHLAPFTRDGEGSR